MITDIRDFTTTPLPIPKIFLVVYLLKLSSECLVSYDPHFPGNDGTNKGIIKGFEERALFFCGISLRRPANGAAPLPPLPSVLS